MNRRKGCTVNRVTAMILVLCMSLSLPAMSFAEEARKDAAAEQTTGTETTVKRSKSIKNGYDEEGNFFDAKGYPLRKSTIRNFLETALLPVGKTVYVWGGGWNEETPTTIGVSEQWERFFRKQTSSYDYRQTRFQTYNGLDCSGYVAWVLYNTFHTESGQGGFLMLAQLMAKTYSDWGWGSYKTARRFKNHKAGDIMSLAAGHVYIVVGRCSDGSLVLLHSSPKGVMINGTVSKNGKKKSKAWKLARKYMRRYFPDWYSKYPDVSRGIDYLRRYSKMSWYIDKKYSVMSDPDGLRQMSAEKVLKVIFSRR